MHPDTQLDLTPPAIVDLDEGAPELVAVAATDEPSPPLGPRLDGDLVVGHGDEIRTALLSLVESGEADDAAIELDLSGVTAIDTAGLQLLLSARRSAAQRGRVLRFASPSEPVRHVLDLVGELQ